MSSNDIIILQKEPDSCSKLPTYDGHAAVLTDQVCPGDIRRMLQWLHAAGETFEIRTLNSQKDKWTKISCGYFRDVEVATEAVVNHVGDYDPAQVYVTLNPTIPSLYARVRDHIEAKQSVTAKDEDIAHRRNILIDCDPVRPANIPSSESELAAAKEKSEAVRAFLTERGLPDPLVGMSGNGYHLIYGVDWEITQDGEDLVECFLKAMAKQFDDAVVKIDLKVHNASRVSKVYGTFPRKGDGADDRVNRMAFIVDAPERVHVDRSLIEALVAEVMPPTDPPAPTTMAKSLEPSMSHSTGSSGKVDIVKFLDRRNIGYRDAGDKYILDACAFNGDHNRGEAAVFQNGNGSLGYHCFHNSCAGKKWADFAEVVGRVEADDYDVPCETTVPVLHSIEPALACPEQFPVDALPDDLSAFVADVADKTRSPEAIVGSTALGVLAACVQNVAVIKRGGWNALQNLSLFVLCIAESAAGKSRGMAPVTRAFRTLQTERQAQIDHQRRSNESLANALEDQRDALLKKYSKDHELLATLNGSNDSSLLQEIQAYEDKIEDLTNPAGGSCLIYDHTIEAALVQMGSTDERAATLDGESRFVDQALGIAYKTHGSPALVCNCWDGDPISNRRVSRGSVVLQHPAMTICNGIQPSLFYRDYLKRNVFSDSGLLQRFLLVQPPGVYEVSADDSEISLALQQAWDRRVLELATMSVSYASGEADDSRPWIEPHVITITSEGDECLRGVEQWVSQTLQAGVDSQHPRWRSWLGRYSGQVIRLAGLLHAYRHGAGFIDVAISVDDVKRAVALGSYYRNEADRILNGVLVNEHSENAQIIRKYIVRKRLQTFRVKDIRDGVRRRIRDDARQTVTQKIKQALEVLVDDGEIYRDTRVHGEQWRVQPTVLKDATIA